MGSNAPAHLFLITYEFCFSTFSGNGILARSLVLSLLQRGVFVTVWCAKPPSNNEGSDSNNGKDHPIEVPEVSQEQKDRLQVLHTTISSRSLWHRLDEESAWSDFTWESLSPYFVTVALEAMKKASAIIVIDWTGHHAWKTTPFCDTTTTTVERKKLVYMNFRVFSSGVKNEAKRKWYDEKERQCVNQADLVVALSGKDKASLFDMQVENANQKPAIQVLVPPLRKDIENLAIQHANSDLPTSLFLDHMPQEARKALPYINGSRVPRKFFVACVVRMSPEKNTLRFVRFVKKMKSFLMERNWVPLLAGSASDVVYSKQVKNELKTLCGNDCVILDSFLPPEALAAIFSCTILNFHPCSYDAYGMSVIEAAAMGVPSVVAAGNTVGASKHVGNGASIEVRLADAQDVDQISDEAVGEIMDKLDDTTRLDAIGMEARKRALAWGEKAYGIALLKHITSINLER